MQCEEEKLYKNMLEGPAEKHATKNWRRAKHKKHINPKNYENATRRKGRKNYGENRKNTKNAGRRAGGRVDTKKYQKIKTDPSERRKKSAPTAAIGSPKNEEITPDNSDQEIN